MLVKRGQGTAMRSEPTMFAGRDAVNPQAGKDCAADVFGQAGITNPREQIDVCEIYDTAGYVKGHPSETSAAQVLGCQGDSVLIEEAEADG